MTTSLDPKTLILLKAAKNGDEDAWRDLYQRYHGYLRYVVKMRLSGRPGGSFDAEDVLQEAFFKAWKRLEQFEYRGEGSFLAWLTRIVVFQLSNQYRTRRDDQQGLETTSFQKAMPASPADTPSEELIQAEAQERMRLSFEKLSEQEQMILGLRLGQSLTWQEIGEILEMHRGAAAKAFARGVERMRRHADTPMAEG